MEFKKRTVNFGVTVAAACLGAGMIMFTGAIVTGQGTGPALTLDTPRAATATPGNSKERRKA